LPPSTVLVLGSNGMLGQALVKSIENRGSVCFKIARRDSDLNLDLKNEHALTEAIDSTKPDVVFNCAGKVSLLACEEFPAETHAINTKMPQTAARICDERDIRFVQISTDHYYSGDGDQKHTESDKVSLGNEYAVSKYQAERLTLMYTKSLVVRTNIVGFRRSDRPTFVEWVITNLQAGKPISLFHDYYTSSIDVRFFSSALLDLVDKNVNGLFNLASSEVSSKKSFVEALAKTFNLGLECAKAVSINEERKIMRNNSCGLDVSKAEKIIGYQLPGLKDVIQNLAKEHKHNFKE